MATWALAEAKAKLSEVVERAERHEPQEITRNGKPVAMMVSMDDWMKQVGERPDGTLVDFFSDSPLSRTRVPLGRPRVMSRRVKF